MTIPKRKRFPTSTLGLDWVETDDGSRTLNQTELDETYHSGCGAVSETLVVYLDLSGVAARLQAGRPSRVLEYGLGTGTALLLTAAVAEFYQTPLEYFALENWNVGGDLVRQLHLGDLLSSVDGPATSAWHASPSWILPTPPQPHDPQGTASHLFALSAEQLRQLTDELAEALQCAATNGDGFGPSAAPERWSQSRLGNMTQLHIRWGDAATYTLPSQQQAFDAIYFDPFSPDSCPELWCGDVYRNACQALQQDGCLVSYCVKSQVRRELGAAGFLVQRHPGPRGGKREVLKAIRKPLR